MTQAEKKRRMSRKEAEKRSEVSETRLGTERLEEEHTSNRASEPQRERYDGDLASLTSEELFQLWREAIERLQDTTKFSDEAQKRAEKAKKRAEKAKKRAEKAEKLNNGTFFATFDEVWHPLAVPFDDADYHAMIRAEIPTSPETLENNVSFPFRITLEKASSSDFDAATDTKPSRPCDIFAQPEHQISRVGLLNARFHNRNDTTKFILPSYSKSSTESVTHSMAVAKNSDDQNQGECSSSSHPRGYLHAHIGYLVPDSSDLASLYHHVAIWVFGVKGHNYEPSFIQKLIHGSEPRRMPENASATVSREIGTGLKHMICNNLRHPGLQYYLDQYPCLMIVPILSLQQAKEWKGQGYHALFIISTGDRIQGRGDAIFNVAHSLVLYDDVGEVASHQDIALAGELLTAVIKGLAYALVEKSSIAENWVSALSDDSREMLDELRRNSTVVNNGDHRITVPIERPGNEKPIRKITFAPAFGTYQHDGHPAPDPLLLAVKAGVNWSAFHGEPLMVTAYPEEYFSDEENSLY